MILILQVNLLFLTPACCRKGLKNLWVFPKKMLHYLSE